MFSSIKTWCISNYDFLRFLIIFIPFIRTYLIASTCNTMVSSIKANNSFFLSVNLSHHHCNIICLRSRVDKGHYTEFFRQFFQQFVCRRHQFVIQKSRICQEFLILSIHSHDIVWVTMTDMRNVVNAIKNFAPVFLIKVLTFCIQNFKRIVSI